MKILLFFLFLSVTMAAVAQKSVYDYKVKSISGGKIDFKDLRGKLIVVVNIASGSERKIQLLQLDSLCRAYASSDLVVVAFPTDDFSKEPKNNKEIRTWVSGLHPNLIVADKTSVRGEKISAFYNWCTK